MDSPATRKVPPVKNGYRQQSPSANRATEKRASGKIATAKKGTGKKGYQQKGPPAKKGHQQKWPLHRQKRLPAKRATDKNGHRQN